MKLWNKEASALASTKDLAEISAHAPQSSRHTAIRQLHLGTVRDGIQLALRNIPTVALVTEPFWQQGDLIALSSGMPDIPRVRLPHPIAGSSAGEMAHLLMRLLRALSQC